jgi:hypothetical protein
MQLNSLPFLNFSNYQSWHPPWVLGCLTDPGSDKDGVLKLLTCFLNSLTSNVRVFICAFLLNSDVRMLRRSMLV